MDRLARALSDRYTIESELGQGGMATVYLAEDLKHKRKVAVKVLRREPPAAGPRGSGLRKRRNKMCRHVAFDGRSWPMFS